MQLDLVAIDATLTQAGIARSLRDALELLDGPIEHAASVRALRHAQWSDLLATCRNPDLTGYLKEPVALGLLKRLSRQDLHRGSQLLEQAQAILLRLPANGLPRAQLAAEVLGNAHALDNGQAIATLVLAVWRRLSDPCREMEATETVTDNGSEWRDESARETWARAGVMVNELARPALVLNLPLRGGEADVSPAGEPGYLSLRRLLRAKPKWDVDGRTVFVCENPNVVAIAADRLGAGCAPLVCTDGMPAAAQRALLDQLCDEGASLCYHGDFDWPGVGIANYVMRAWKARPWRFSACDYEAAVLTVPTRQRDLAEGNIAASWDLALACEMSRHGLAIAEEAVVGPLLQDMGPQPWRP